MSVIIWLIISIAGAAGWAVLALHRGETINAAWLVLAAVCSYLIAYRFYSHFLASKSCKRLDDRRITPAHRLNNGRQGFCPDVALDSLRSPLRRDRRRGAARGARTCGAVRLPPRHHLDCRRRDPRRRGPGLHHPRRLRAPRRQANHSGQMAKEEEIGPVTGFLAMIAILAIMVILIAVLALIIVKAADGVAVGRVHTALHHPDRLRHGDLDEGGAARQDDGGDGGRCRTAAPRGGRRPVGRRITDTRTDVHAERHDNFVGPDGLWLPRLRDPRVDAARTSRLSLHLRQDRHRHRARLRHSLHTAGRFISPR